MIKIKILANIELMFLQGKRLRKCLRTSANHVPKKFKIFYFCLK